ncbi:hypothetical protein GH808_04200 [Acetobacterium fimetarium]|uniref:MORN repeat-containing protein n=1 Tax=Acetobacterium fimetarium TaxID=52691 RepID=A0ABR6WSS4_9FIRM|nr:hypothetical protein [Acetobacterium fimetarium]MBC3803634.1 hypothetical protein [Acetobacterium fimetarium]
MRKIGLVFMAITLMLVVSACSSMPGSAKSADKVTDKEMTLTLSFGEKTGTYTGELVDGLPQGKGTFTSENGSGIGWSYEGEWEKGHMQGSGETVYDSGFKETGVYQNDELNGAGKEYWDDQLFYEGNYKNNQYDGQGTLTNYRGEVVYSGNFSKGYYTETSEQRQARLEPFKAQAVELPYSEIVDNAKNETGKKVKITGRVFQVDQKTESEPAMSYFFMQLGSDPSQIVRVSYLLNQGEVPPVKDQSVTVWATAELFDSYALESGTELTVPYVEAWSVE